jgi:hypothetical protein
MLLLQLPSTILAVLNSAVLGEVKPTRNHLNSQVYQSQLAKSLVVYSTLDSRCAEWKMGQAQGR